jgi:hypothetical protein
MSGGEWERDETGHSEKLVMIYLFGMQFFDQINSLRGVKVCFSSSNKVP